MNNFVGTGLDGNGFLEDISSWLIVHIQASGRSGFSGDIGIRSIANLNAKSDILKFY
jgi:hypothetical protein